LRRKRVNDQSGYSNELTSWLKQIFPQALGWFPDAASPGPRKFPERWPALAHLRRARRSAIRKFWLEHNVEATSDPALLQAGVPAIGQLLGLPAELRRSIAELDR
jgi:hypothetical protein